MESANIATSILRIQQLPAYQAGGQQQQSPFAQGQFLQGSVSAKNGSGQFTIDIGGQQILADSAAQLQVGQKLDLQVAALVPRIELRIVDNPANRLAGNSIHFVGTQASTVAALTSLAQRADLLPQLSSTSRQTLQFFADSLAGGRPVSLTDSPVGSPGEQLLARALSLLQTSSGSSTNVPLAEISAVLQQAGQSPSLAPETARLAQVLAEYYTQGADLQQTSGPVLTRLSEALQNNPVSDKEIMQLLTTITRLAQDQPQLGSIAELILPLLQKGVDSGPAPSLLQPLIVFLVKLDSDNQRQQPPLQGKELQEIVDKLGLSMERQLAEGRPEEAAKTLKFALVELSQHLLTDTKSAHQAEQMAKSIESYQLLQMRLSSESLVFLPLPFSFLQQGYLLVDSEQSGQRLDSAQEQTAAIYELHLQLQGLGNISIAIDQREGRVSLTFQTEDAERARFLAGFREELGQQLTAAQLESVQFLVGSKEPVKTLYEKIIQGLSGMVDTTI